MDIKNLETFPIIEHAHEIVVRPIQEGEILLGGRNNYAMRRHFREEFLHRLKVAKRSQP